MKTILQNQKILCADLVLLFVAAIWGGGFVAAKLALDSMTPAAILMYRFCGAALIVGVLFHRHIQKAERKEILCGLSIGIVQFLALFVQLVGLQYTTPAKQSFLASAYILFTPFAAWLFTKEKPVKRDLASALLAICGIACISLNGDLSVQAGDPITLGFALLFSLQIILTGQYAKSQNLFVLTFFQFASAGILALLLVLITGVPVTCQALPAVSGVIYLVIANTALAMLLQNTAQKYTKDSHTALLLSFESVFGLLFSVIIYGDVVTPRMLCGCVCFMIAVLTSKKIF